MPINRLARGFWLLRPLSSRRSRLYAVIAGSFSLILLLVLAFVIQNIREAGDDVDFNTFLEAKGEVLRLDEVLTMSAMVGAATGDARWKERYDANIPILDAALERALVGADEEAKRAIAGTSDANNALVDMETRAFALSKEGRFPEALALLQSDAYRDYKEKYAAGANQALASIKAHLDWRRRISATVVAILATLGILLIGAATLLWKRIIDAQLDARGRLERTEAHLLKALGLAEAAVWEADLRHGVFASPSNLCAFLGKTEKSDGGPADFWSRFLHPDDIGRVKGIWMERLEAGAPLDMELRVKLIDGRWCWTRILASTEAGDNGRPVRAVGLLQNIDKRKTYEQELQDQRVAAEAATIAKSQFLATMSHEIRTPMNGVLGMLDLLLRSGLQENQRWPAKVACDSANALLRILDDILDYSKLEAGQVIIEATGFNFYDITKGVVSLLSPRCEEKGLAIACDIADAVPEWVIGDPVRYRQILTNLLSNAVKFTEKGGVQVEATGKVEGGTVKVRVSVRDSGIGISPEAQAQLFQRFAQADATTTRKFGGTGLGLAITKQLVELMGGSIHMESKAGEGCTFWFNLGFGVGEAPAVSPIAAADEETAALVLPPLRVLLAEDNKVNQMIVQAYLKPGRHEVVVVGNGKEAVEMVKARPFDIILMDVQMPVMDGPMATKLIRELPGEAGTLPIIALTANVLTGDRESYLRAGMTAYLSKPIDCATLLRAIADAAVPAILTEAADRKKLQHGASSG